MNVLVLISSALGENSAGRATFKKVLEHSKFEKEQEVREVILNGKTIDEVVEDVKWCDLLIVVAFSFWYSSPGQKKICLYGRKQVF